MKITPLIIVMLSISGCSRGFERPEPPDISRILASQKDTYEYLGEGAKVLAVCGGSVGKSLFLNAIDQGFVNDSIVEGSIIFALRENGQPEILTRDISPELIVASEDGGIVTRVSAREQSGLGLWNVSYPSTGVIISHNLTGAVEGNLVDLWVQNKPPVSLMPARTSTFVSSCEMVP